MAHHDSHTSSLLHTNLEQKNCIINFFLFSNFYIKNCEINSISPEFKNLKKIK